MNDLNYMLLSRNSGRKDTAFLLIDKYFRLFSLLSVIIYQALFLIMSIVSDTVAGWLAGHKFPW